jgi:hypothetical protein
VHTQPAPAVSVVMTAYNRERYVAAAIESVLAQTFRDFELIVVDDKSSDGTAEVALRYTSDPRVRVEFNAANLGDYPNRNHAATLARGEFLKYHDSDDVMYAHCLETMVRHLSNEPRAAFALTTSAPWSGGPCPMLLTPRLAYAREYLGHGLFQVGPSCALFRREAFLELGRFPEAGSQSDGLFWMRASARVNVLLVPGDLFWYRIHPGQELQAEKSHYDTAILERDFWRALDSPACPLTAAEREQAKRNSTARLLKRMLTDLRGGRPTIAWTRFRRSGRTLAEWIRYARRQRRDIAAGCPVDTRDELFAR